ncbi:hypothetical protein MTR67_030404, partial [Solanum verrucosum]
STYFQYNETIQTETINSSFNLYPQNHTHNTSYLRKTKNANFRSCRCNPRFPPTDHRVTQAHASGPWMATCDPSRETPRNLSKCRPTVRPTDRRSGHGPWSTFVDQTPNYSLSVAK